MQNLSGKTAIVTGGGSGIGLAIGKALLKAGMNVAIADVLDDHLDHAKEELNGHSQALTMKLDVTNREDYATFADAVEARFGKIHLLVNNAGVVVSGPIAQASYDDWDWVLGVNLFGVINGLVTILPRMIAHGEGGHIVNTASTSGLLPHPGAAIYSTSKSALIGLSESIRCELEPQGIIVSVFCPGPVQSNIGASEKARPVTLAKSGYQPAPTRDKSAGDSPGFLMPADDVGEIVREGIEQDRLYILTHSEHRAGLEERAAAILSALPDRPENAELKAALGICLLNPAHTAEIKRSANGKK